MKNTDMAIQPMINPTMPPRERILQAAGYLFYTDGIRATGIDRLIAEAGVTKVTFYRQFSSKDALILAFLQHRYQRWMTWFKGALQRHGANLAALVPTLAEWFKGEAEGLNAFRGCAFINSLAELGDTLEGVKALSRQHKQDMTTVIAALLLDTPQQLQQAAAIALAVDGCIVRAQYEENPQAALQALEGVLALYLAARQ